MIINTAEYHQSSQKLYANAIATTFAISDKELSCFLADLQHAPPEEVLTLLAAGDLVDWTVLQHLCITGRGELEPMFCACVRGADANERLGSQGQIGGASNLLRSMYALNGSDGQAEEIQSLASWHTKIRQREGLTGREIALKDYLLYLASVKELGCGVKLHRANSMEREKRPFSCTIGDGDDDDDDHTLKKRKESVHKHTEDKRSNLRNSNLSKETHNSQAPKHPHRNIKNSENIGDLENGSVEEPVNLQLNLQQHGSVEDIVDGCINMLKPRKSQRASNKEEKDLWDRSKSDISVTDNGKDKVEEGKLLQNDQLLKTRSNVTRTSRRKSTAEERVNVKSAERNTSSCLEVQPKPKYHPRPEDVRDPQRASFVMRHLPPSITHTAYGLIQEALVSDPFALLVAVTLLNKTKGTAAVPIFFDLIRDYPTPAALAEASIPTIANRIGTLGLQNNRAKSLVAMAQRWCANPPARGCRYRRLHYPVHGAGSDIRPAEVVADEVDDAREGAFEIAHLPGVGPYALDSWRIFCRDLLRGVAEGYNGEGAEGRDGKSGSSGEFEPEWKRVVPKDKELRGFLKWMWAKEGVDWDPETGRKRRVSGA